MIRFEVFSRAALAALFVVFALAPATAMAKDGRDFAGHYALTSVTESGNQVELTLALRLINYSGADLKQAIVSVRAQPEPQTLGTFTPIKLWREGTDITVSEKLTISREQFRRWSGNNQPNVFVMYRDETGREWRRWAQLSRRPTIPEALPVPVQ